MKPSPAHAAEGFKAGRQKQLFVLANLFKFTASQEKIHAEVFHSHLIKTGCNSVEIAADYPNDISQEPLDLLTESDGFEQKESDEVYPAFAETARAEGFPDIARDFENIAAVEASHARRFRHYASLLENGRLFSSDCPEKWLCLNCGYLHDGTSAPETCPVCAQPQGWFIRLAETPWGLDTSC